MTAESVTRAVVRRFLEAVEARDLDAIGSCFTGQASYRNVPEPPVIGPAGVRSMFAPIISRSERVVWDIVSEAYAGDRAHLERLDRFWIDGVEYVAPCHGVVIVDPAVGRISEFRDYVDLAPWRSRVGAALRAPGD
jgi:limonene-1,2-epoxide hydrolase